ncbi:MAG: GNAT family N-acetyltransferase, partial [Desulfobacterales bacterium]|nr:GNAT family N-acetyltransferase [Desulfobacterales bacterium]
MLFSGYWADDYIKKKKDVREAIQMIKSGQRVFIGSYCGEPQHLVKGFAEGSGRLSDIEIIRLMSAETTSLTMIANKTRDQRLNIRSIYLGSAKSENLAKNMRFYTPMNLSEVPRLFKKRLIPINVALIQVRPPDDFGWMSLGVSVDVTMAAAQSADIVIAQVNSRMPMVLGRSFIHVNDVDAIVEYDEDLLTISSVPIPQRADMIGKHIARLIEDGSTLQIGLDAASQATTLALSEKNDLGIHSQFLTVDMMRLYSLGVINNKKKGFNDGKMVAGCAVGTKNLYEFLDINPAVDFYPFDYINDIDIISRHNKMVSMNVAQYIDLAGQVSCDALEYNLYAGVSGIPDFVRGSNRSKNGKSIIMINATAKDNKESRIVPMLNNTIVTIPREDIRWVVTEFGVANLYGKSTQERALAIISIAHPDFREELLFEAKKMGMVGPDRILGESVRGVYPVRFEETIRIAGEKILFRPAKPVDERRIQEHFYQLEKIDVVSRFFHEKTRFVRQEVQGMFQVDYIHNLTIIALVGESGFDKVVGVGSYYFESSDNMAEVAFSVSKEYQGKGLGNILIRKLA